MNLPAIAHRPISDFIYPKARDQLAIQLITAVDDVDEVILVIWERYENKRSKSRRLPMTRTFRDRYHDTYRITVKTESIAAYQRYGFLLKTRKETVWYGAEGFTAKEPKEACNFFEFLWPNPADLSRAPAWSSSQIYYQIFPERFRNGDPSISPAEVMPWESAPTSDNWMGGDLAGIRQKLDYIQELGVTCLYLTPIFMGTSNHKYDTIDYYRIDPNFGSEDEFLKLVEEIHKRKMRIMLDGVFNHCGFEFPQFQDVLRNGENSRYKNWFFIQSYPVQIDPCNYDCVGHYKWMPKLNLGNSETARYFLDVGAYWIQKYDIDGWRLDVADEVPTSFWEAFSAELKLKYPNIMLLGETWGDAHRLISGNRLDTAMNYLFKDAVTEWLAKDRIRPSDFDHLVNRMLSLYQDEQNLRMYNLLDSHDTARFLYESHGNVQKLKLAVAIQMTFPGCPAIYYGDEVGLSGPNDPGCRCCMEWNPERQNQELLKWYRKLITLRKTSSSIMNGDYRMILCDDSTNAYGYLRMNEEEETLVLINAGRDDYPCTVRYPFENSGSWVEVFGEKNLRKNLNLTKYQEALVTLPGYSVKIYKKRKSR